MRDEWLIQIDDIYLTDDGMETGVRYLSNVEGADSALRPVVETKRVDFRGNVIYQTATVGKKNKEITITLQGLTFELADDLEEAYAAHKETPAPIILACTHPYSETASFILSCNWDAFEYTNYLTATWRDVTLRFTSFDEFEEEEP